MAFVHNFFGIFHVTDGNDNAVDYMVNTYIGDNVLFPPEVWSAAPDTDTPSTANHQRLRVISHAS